MSFLSRWKILLLVILLFVAAVFSQVVSFTSVGFWDDNINVFQNPFYAPLTWKHVLAFWSGPYMELYIPVTYTVWSGLVLLSRWIAGISISFGEIHPMIFHAMNLLMHLGSVAMVFLILRKFLAAFCAEKIIEKEKPSQSLLLTASAAGALLFGLHPMQVEAVAWISCLRDLLGAFFSLVALYIFLIWTEEKTSMRKQCLLFLVSTLFFLLALGSKPGTVVLPLIVLLFWGTMNRDALIVGTRKYFLGIWFLISLLFVVLTSYVQVSALLARELSPVWARPLIAIDALSFYLTKIFLPLNLSADYGRSPDFVLEHGQLYWTWLLPVGFGLLLLFWKQALIFCTKSITACERLIATTSRSKSDLDRMKHTTAASHSSARLLFMSLAERLITIQYKISRLPEIFLLPYALFVIGVAPTLGLIPFNFQVVSTVSDRYLYFAMIGPALALSLAIIIWPKRITYLFVVLLLSVCTITTLYQLPQWASTQNFCEATLALNPKSWKTQHNYAHLLDTQGNQEEAIEHFKIATRLRPQSAEARNDFGLVYLNKGCGAQAAQLFQESLQLRPTSVAANNLALAFLIMGQPRQAIEAFQFGIKLDPENHHLVRELAWLLSTNPDASVRNGQKAAQLSRDIIAKTHGKVPLYILTLAAAQAEEGNFSEAIVTAQQASLVFEQTGNSLMVKHIKNIIIPCFQCQKPLREGGVVSGGMFN